MVSSIGCQLLHSVCTLARCGLACSCGLHLCHGRASFAVGCPSCPKQESVGSFKPLPIISKIGCQGVKRIWLVPMKGAA